jgi:hypothetical protein
LLFLLFPALAVAEYVNLQTVAITTNGSGADTEYTAVVTGCVAQVHYIPDGTAPLDTGADLDITMETTGVVVANHDDIGTSAFTRAYRQATHGVDGSASLYAGSGEPVEAPICVANDRLKVVIANGASTKSGTFYIWVK